MKARTAIDGLSVKGYVFGNSVPGHDLRAALLLPGPGVLMARDVGREEIAATRHRLDDGVRVVGEGRPHVTDAARQRFVAHHHLRPHRGGERLF